MALATGHDRLDYLVIAGTHVNRGLVPFEVHNFAPARNRNPQR
jgi:hypothetical protein